MSLFVQEASSEELKRGDYIVVVENASLTENGNDVEAVLAGMVMRVYDVKDELLHVSFHKNVWINRQHVIPRDIKSIGVLNEMIKKDPDNAQLWNGRGIVILELNTRLNSGIWLERAMKDFDEAIRLAPDNSMFYVERARGWQAVFNMGLRPEINAVDKIEKTLADYDRAIELDDKNALAYAFRGRFWQDVTIAQEIETAWKKGAADFTRAIELDPNNGSYYLARANDWMALKEYDKAIKDCTKALELRYLVPDVVAVRARAWNALGELDKAGVDYTMAIILSKGEDSDQSQLNSYYQSLASIKIRKKNFSAAAENLTKAIQLNPNDEYPYMDRAQVWMSLKEYEKALQDWQHVVKIQPSSFYIKEIGVLQLILRQPQAVRQFQSIIDKDDWSGPLAANAVTYGYLSSKLLGEEKQAKRFLEESQGRLNESFDKQVVQFLRNKISETELLKQAKEMESRENFTDRQYERHARCCLGLFELIKGRQDKARNHFDWVKEHDDDSTDYNIALAELDRLDAEAKK